MLLLISLVTTGGIVPKIKIIQIAEFNRFVLTIEWTCILLTSVVIKSLIWVTVAGAAYSWNLLEHMLDN